MRLRFVLLMGCALGILAISGCSKRSEQAPGPTAQQAQSGAAAGLGLFGASAMSFLDFVNVLTITNSAAVAALNPQCKKVTLDEVAHPGVDLNVMPIPIPLVETVASQALSQKKQLWHHHWDRVTPNIKMCQI